MHSGIYIHIYICVCVCVYAYVRLYMHASKYVYLSGRNTSVRGAISGCEVLLTKAGRRNVTSSMPRWDLSTLPFGIFRGFLRNSRKYGLGSIRKTPGGHSPGSQNPTCGKLALYLQPNFHISL